MKRLHVHIAVPELSSAVTFYGTLFGAAPTVLKSDYAKWMLEDPRVNFAISARGATPGVEHLGIQVESEEDLAALYGKLEAADGAVLEEGETTCCYARSTKSWIADPAGVAWEAFFTHGDHTTYGDSALIKPAGAEGEAASACCGPKPDFSAAPKSEAAPTEAKAPRGCCPSAA